MIMKKSINSWKATKNSVVSNNDSIKLRTKKSSKKQITSAKLSENDSEGFESFVQEKLKKQGFALSEEEQKLVQEAIEKAMMG